jgi:glucokinase
MSDYKNPMGAILGLDIGGTRLKAALVSREGKIIAAERMDTPVNINGLQQGVGAMFEKLSGQTSAIESLGIGCKGIINPLTTRVEVLPGSLNYLEGHVLADLVRPALPRNTQIAADNDARVALFGERAWGAARNLQHALMFTLGTGIGGGILTDGRILRGATGVAGHVGHLTIEPDGLPCICGNFGCLETVFSARALEGEAAAVLHRGVETYLRRLDGACPTCADVFECARLGDRVASRILQTALRKLAAGIAGLVHVFDPEVLIFGGQIVDAGDRLLAPLQREIAERTRLLLRRDVPVVRSELADPSGVIGAAALAMQLNA